MTIKQVKFTEIKIDAGTQYRDELDQAVVAEYAEKMRDGVKFPPLRTIFDGINHILVDGFTRYFALLPTNPKYVEVDYKPGTIEEAQVIAMGVNDDHGQRRSHATKIKIVTAALEHPLTMNMSNREIAKVCNVSDVFVAGVRNPEIKEKRSNAKKAGTANKVLTLAPNVEEHPHESREDHGPSEAELAADAAMEKAQMDQINTLIESDDKFATLMEENKKLLAENVKLKLRISGLLNERNEAIKQAKSAQSKLDKLSKK